jgi:hypothetical protein
MHITAFLDASSFFTLHKAVVTLLAKRLQWYADKQFPITMMWFGVMRHYRCHYVVTLQA